MVKHNLEKCPTTIPGYILKNQELTGNDNTRYLIGLRVIEPRVSGGQSGYT